MTTEAPKIPVTFEYRAETGEMFTLDTTLVALPLEGHSVSWDDGHAALSVQDVIVGSDRVIIRIHGLMRQGSIPTYVAGGWRR